MELVTGADSSLHASRRALLWIVAVFCISRLFLFPFNEAEFTDGYFYVQWSFAHPGFRHPLYPILIQAFSLFLDPILAGRLVSSLAGVGSLFALYALGRKVYGEKAAIYACGLFTISPLIVWIHTRVLSESLFLSLFLLTLFYFLKCLENLSWKSFFLMVLFSGLAMLTRPEGIAFVPLIFFTTFYYIRRGSWKAVLKGSPGLLTWLFFFAWMLLEGWTYKNVMESSLRQATIVDLFTYLILYLESYPYVACYPVFALALLGFLERSPAGRFRWILTVAYVHVLWFAALSIHRWWSTRFLIPPLSLLLIEAAAMLESLQARWSKLSWIALTAFIIVSSTVLAGASLYFQKEIFADIKSTAIFAGKQFPKQRLISDEVTKVAYYSKKDVVRYDRGASLSPGDVLLLHSFYTPLTNELQALSQKYNMVLLGRSRAYSIPILANIHTETSRETHSPIQFVWRFQRQRFESFVIGIKSRKVSQ
jgi:4-amino-4-deoxy-L-arabinose transferase-like glycosyltransferase